MLYNSYICCICYTTGYNVTSVRLTTCGPPVQTERFSLCCLLENVPGAATVFFSKRTSDASAFGLNARVSGAGSLLWSTGTYEASLTGANAVVRNFSITSLNSSDTLQHHRGEVWKCGFYGNSSQYTIPQTRKHFFLIFMQTKCGFSRFLF